LEKQGFGFVDLCTDDVADHYAVQDDGTLNALTPSAEYTERMVRLNSRHLREIRGILVELGVLGEFAELKSVSLGGPDSESTATN
jgi:hypothetical protein